MFVPSTGWSNVEDHRKIHEEKQKKIKALEAEMRSIDCKLEDLSEQYHLLKSQKRKLESDHVLQKIEKLTLEHNKLRVQLSAVHRS